MRTIVWSVILAVLSAASSAAAIAQAFPAKPLRMIAPFPAGGSLDAIARALAQPMSVSLGKPVIVENRPGATGIVGAELVARAPADGHTILIMGSVFSINAA